MKPLTINIKQIMPIAADTKPQPLPENKRFRDLTGRRFGKYTALHYLGKIKRNSAWLCACDCGNKAIVHGGGLSSGGSKSCGCSRAESMSKTMKKHGKTETREYVVWGGMKARCTNPKNSRFNSYGGRGIKVCDRWLHSFQNFLNDMGIRPSPKHSIERKNNDGNYEPDNCVWATKSEQANNRRGNTRIEFLGKNLTISQWSKELGFPQWTIPARMKSNWPMEKVFNRPIRPQRSRAAARPESTPAI